ncbi:MAG: serine/threonine protein kinase [Bradymonadales bacterium]|nr:serine/threonine protein kinase [Bradymonadales bacterium]
MIQPIVFGNLCLLERINIGGMAEIYRAKPFNTPAFDRFLAVKRMLPNLSEDAEFASMFVDEAKIAIRLNHPNICQNYELGRLGGTPYIVMEYIAGQSLLAIHKRLRTQRKIIHYIPAAYIAREVANALDYAHACQDDNGNPLGLVHRDVSPHNILISYAGEVKLIDFGIAKVRSSSHITQVGVLKGKFGYMSPEQVDGLPIDGRSDLFALGIVLYEMLTGKRLFLGKTDFDTLENVRRAQVKTPSFENPWIPEELDEIVMRILARNPAQRFQCGAELAEQLTRFLESGDRPFTSTQLSDWMLHYFAQELEAERESRELFRQFVTAEDVDRHNARLLDEIRQSMGAPAVDVGEPLLDEEEITQVVAAEQESLLPSLTGWSPSRDQVQEVIAENLYEPLPSLIARHRASVLANVDLPEPHVPEPISELFEPDRPRSRRWLLLLPLLLVAGLAAAFAIRRLTDGEKTDPALQPGLIALEVTPSTGLQVFLSGRLVGDHSPLFLRGLEAGEYRIEIRHPDYQSHREVVQVDVGRMVTRAIVLAELPEGQGSVDLSLDPSDAEVWLDGTLVDGTGGARHLSISSGERHLLEIREPGYFVEERWITLRPGDQQSLEVTLNPVNARLVVVSQPGGRAFLDGIEVGSTASGLRLESLDPHRPYHLRIETDSPGFRSYETTILFETVLEKNLFVPLRLIGEPSYETTPEYGLLAIVSTPRWYRVFLEGSDTGLTTPISADQPLALRTGRREIELVRGLDRVPLVVTIERNQLTLVDCSLDQWACGE